MRERGTPRTRLLRFSFAIVTLAGLVGVGLTARAQTTGNASRTAADVQFELPTDPNQVVVSFVERFGELEDADYPTLHVYADGRVVRHRPAYMQQRGDFNGRISRDDVQQLVRTLAEGGVLEFDAPAVRRATSEARERRALTSMMTDPSVIEIEVRLVDYRLDKSATPQQDFRKTVRWTALRYDARTYTDVDAVQGLAAAYQRLNELAVQIEQTGFRQGGAR